MKILLAVSGGIDSMCMASMAPELFRESAFYVAHCNFSLRGEESDGDERLVREWTESKGYTFFSTKFDTTAYAREKGISIEMAARELRYDWFAALCKENGLDAVAVAHNANDNAETMILNMLRGSGGRGMRGMAREGKVPGHPEVTLLRPLLETSRAEIEAYARTNGIPYREDRTNSDSSYHRNRIRNEVFPQFGRINPSFLESLTRTMSHLAQENDIAEDWFQSVRPSFKDGISVRALRSTRHWKYVLYRLMEPYSLNEESLNSLTELIENGETFSGKTFTTETHRIVTASDSIIITPLSGLETEGNDHLTVNAPGEYTVCGRTVTVRLSEKTADTPLKQPAGVLISDADVLTFPFTLRKWRKGDWMVPFGMKGRKKISDLFVDLKWSLVDKEKAVVIDSGHGDSHVLALIGARSDDSTRVSGRTKSILTII